MVAWWNKNKLEITILLLLGVIVDVRFYGQICGSCVTFADTDDYMRLVRIRDFFLHYDLANTVISRCNVPFGCDLHWTRFYDFFIIIPAYILNIFIDSNKSIEYVGLLIGPVIRSITAIMLFSLCQKFMKKNDAFLTTAIFPCHPLICGINHFGRPDHHAFIMLFMILYLKSVIDVVLAKFNGENLYLKPAIIAALCVWISPETLIPILLTDGILFIYAFANMKRLKFLHMKNTLIACGIGMIVFFSPHQMFNCILTTCILLMVIPYATTQSEGQLDRILKYWHIVVMILMLLLCPLIIPVEYDKISAVHVFLFVCSAIYFGISMVYYRLELKCRVALSAVWLTVIAAVFLFLYPKFFSGMSANIDDYVKEIWLSKVREMQSPLAGDGKVDFLVYCVILIASISSKVARLLPQKRVAADIIWCILIGNAAVYTILAGMAYRMQPYAILFGLPIIVDFAVNGDFAKSIHRLWRVVVALFLTTFFLFFTVFFSDSAPPEDVKHAYTPKELFELIDNLSKTPVVLMAHIDDGPALLYHTKHSVVSAPYHRQESGITSSHRIMDAKYDEETTKSILKTTNSSYIFIKKHLYEKNHSKPESLAQMLINGNRPDWISILKLPPRFSDIIVAKIDQKKL